MGRYTRWGTKSHPPPAFTSGCSCYTQQASTIARAKRWQKNKPWYPIGGAVRQQPPAPGRDVQTLDTGYTTLRPPRYLEGTLPFVHLISGLCVCMQADGAARPRSEPRRRNHPKVVLRSVEASEFPRMEAPSVQILGPHGVA